MSLPRTSRPGTPWKGGGGAPLTVHLTLEITRTYIFDLLVLFEGHYSHIHETGYLWCVGKEHGAFELR